MADILLVSDIEISDTGDIKLVYNNDDILQSAINNIKLEYGELQLHSDIGNKMYSNRIKISESGLTDIETYCERAILLDTRIDRVNNIEAIRIDNNTCRIDFSLLTISGDTIQSNISISI